MLPRIIIFGLALSFVLSAVNSAEAQFGLFRGDRFGDRQRMRRLQNQGNPADEQSKTEAEQAYQKGQYDRGIELTNQVLQRNPSDHVAYYLRASCRVELGLQKQDTKEIRGGVADAREAIRLGGDRNSMYYLPYLYGMTRLAMLENRKGHAEVVVTVADQALGIQGLSAEEQANLLYQRAGAQVYLREFDKGVADYRRAIQLVPTHLGAHVAIADAYVFAEKDAEATAAFDAAVQAFPSNPLVFNNRGMHRQRKGQINEAIADFTMALQLDPKYYVALTNRGFALLEQGDAAAADNDFTDSLRANPYQPLVYNLRGQARIDQGRLAEAIADHRKVVEFDQQSGAAYADLGFALYFAKNYDAALAALDKSAELDKQGGYLAPWQYICLVESGKENEAKTRFAASLNKPAEQREWIDKALVMLSGNLSAEELLAGVADDPSYRQAQLCEANYFLGWRIAHTGDTAGAEQYYRAALESTARNLSAYRGAKFALGQIPVQARTR